MRQVVIKEPGEADVLIVQSAERPTPGPGQVLIQVFAAGVNRPDILQRQGRYDPPADASPILGLEVAGEVVACGHEASAFKPGDKVCALAPGGGYADYCVVPEGQVLVIPRGLSFLQAAGVPETFFTVWSNVFDRGQLKPGETLLVHGGSSGIGTTAIQLARHLGSKVFATAGGQEKCRACLELGVHRAIDYKTEDFLAVVKEETNGRGVDVILDMVGGSYIQKNIRSLAPDGRLVQIAFLESSTAPLDLMSVMLKRLTLTGSTLRPRSLEYKAQLASALKTHVWPLLEQNKVRVVVDSCYSLEQVAEAHLHMESNRHIGKIILKLSEQADQVV
jgi:putative PIG3 family NAD(P)H quinone oxidoreductase